MGWGAWGGVPNHVHARTHTKRKDKHVRKLQMATTMEAAMFIMFNMHACVCAHACMHVHMRTYVRGAPTQPPGGVPSQISKNAIRLERIKIFRFRLKIWNLWRIPHPWVGDFLVGGWVG